MMSYEGKCVCITRLKLLVICRALFNTEDVCNFVDSSKVLTITRIAVSVTYCERNMR